MGGIVPLTIEAASAPIAAAVSAETDANEAGGAVRSPTTGRPLLADLAARAATVLAGTGKGTMSVLGVGSAGTLVVSAPTGDRVEPTETDTDAVELALVLEVLRPPRCLFDDERG